MAPYPGALTLNFRQSVPGKPPILGLGLKTLGVVARKAALNGL
jgi:hypothetical protein